MKKNTVAEFVDTYIGKKMLDLTAYFVRSYKTLITLIKVKNIILLTSSKF